MINNINKLQMNKTRQLMDILEVLQRTLKTAQAPGLNNRSWQTIPVPHDSDRIGKEYLCGLLFAGLIYSLYGWLARVELHLVSSKRSSKFSLFMPKTILQHSTKERNNLHVSSVGHFCFLKRSSYSISLRFSREKPERLFAELFLKLAHLQPNMGSRPEQHIQEPGAREICITQRTHRDSTSPLFCEPNPTICQPY